MSAQASERVRHPIQRIAYSPDEVAEMVGCTRNFIDAQCKAGKLKSSRCGQRRFIRVADLEQWLADGAGR